MFKDFNSFSKVDNTYKTYKLDKDLIWNIGKENSEYLLVLKEGYTFDISVPKYLECFLSPHNQKILLAAAIHDAYLKLNYNDYFATAEFRRACVLRGCNHITATILFILIMIFKRVKYHMGYYND